MNERRQVWRGRSRVFLNTLPDPPFRNQSDCPLFSRVFLNMLVSLPFEIKVGCLAGKGHAGVGVRREARGTSREMANWVIRHCAGAERSPDRAQVQAPGCPSQTPHLNCNWGFLQKAAPLSPFHHQLKDSSLVECQWASSVHFEQQPPLSACSPALANGHSSRKKGEGPKEAAQRTETLPLWDGIQHRRTPCRTLPDIDNKPSPNSMVDKGSRHKTKSAGKPTSSWGARAEGGRASDHSSELWWSSRSHCKGQWLAIRTESYRYCKLNHSCCQGQKRAVGPDTQLRPELSWALGNPCRSFNFSESWLSSSTMSWKWLNRLSSWRKIFSEITCEELVSG